MWRRENVLHVGAERRIVECTDATEVVIPGVEGTARYDQLQHHLDVERMSKSRGNVVNPDELVSKWGADTVRGYMMFAFDWSKGGPWDSQNILGVQRFLTDVWKLVAQPAPDKAGTASADEQAALRRKTHQTIQKVTRELDHFSFNTAMAAQMELKNAMQKARGACHGTEAWSEAIGVLVRLMAPFTPHIAEELWAAIGGEYSVHTQAWPEADDAVAAEDTITLVVQVKGKVRGRVEVPADISEEAAREAALADENVQRYVEGKELRKVIFVPGKLINIVV